MKYDINLIARKEFNAVDKILYFFLNYLRYVLVITQFIVIGVLFYRFKIDQNIIDLQDSIEQKQEIIQIVKPLLAEANKIDQQVQAVKTVTADQEALAKSIGYLLSVFPKDLSLTKLTVENSVFNLEGITLNPKLLQQFYIRLKKDNKFSTVTLDNIKREEAKYVFNFQLSGYK